MGIKHTLSVMLSVVILGTGCTQLKPPIQQPDPSVDFTFRILPLITRNTDGLQSWSLNDINRYITTSNEILGQAGIALKIEEVLIDPESSHDHIGSYLEVTSLEPLSAAFYNDRGVLPIWFVRRIEIGGKRYGGLATYPSVPLFNYTTVIGRDSGRSTLAHEVCHLFNLPHAWENKDLFPESDYVTRDTCHAQCNNIMSYCSFRGADQCESLWPSQIAEMRRWVFHPVRVKALMKGRSKTRAMRSLNSTLKHKEGPTCVR